MWHIGNYICLVCHSQLFCTKIISFQYQNSIYCEPPLFALQIYPLCIYNWFWYIATSIRKSHTHFSTQKLPNEVNTIYADTFHWTSWFSSRCARLLVQKVSDKLPILGFLSWMMHVLLFSMRDPSEGTQPNLPSMQMRLEKLGRRGGGQDKLEILEIYI